jgi:glycosyltransferase involved in cell wall biosynthesis
MADSLRILHLVSCSHMRGAEVAARELADELHNLGHWNRVVALSRAYDGGQVPGLDTLSTSPRNTLWEVPVWVRGLRRLLASEPVDVLMAHDGWTPHVTALAVRRGGPLLVWQRILPFDGKMWLPAVQQVQSTVARRFDAAVALTEDMVDEMNRLGFRGPVWTIPNFRKQDRFLQVDREVAAARLRAELGIADDTHLVGYVGHLIEQKRPERLLEVLALLRNRGCRAHLVVAGSGPLADDLVARAEELGLSEVVTFLGHRTDVEWVFGGVDVSLLTSDIEGIPGVAIEALMSGCPMVTVPVCGVAEVVEDGVTGLVLDSHEPAVMADAVATLLADEDLRTSMSERARKHADAFSAASAAEVYAERITSALAFRRSSVACG